MKHEGKLLEKLKTFISNTRGNVAFIFAASAITLITVTGIAVDFGRAYLVRSSIASALDAAILAGGQDVNSPTLEQDVEMYFRANYPEGFMNVTVSNIGISKESGGLRLKISASIPTILLKVVGIDKIDASVENAIVQKNSGSEVVIVMDNTGSMQFDPFINQIRDCSGSGCNPMQAVKFGAKTLVDILYGDNESVDGLYLGLVPYIGVVNPGVKDTSWLQTPPGYFDSDLWKGCVMARHVNGNDSTDATPSEEPFEPYYLQHSRDQLFYPNQNPNRRPLRFGRYLVIGDANYNTNPNTIRESVADYGNSSINIQGPNVGCPSPITPLTTSKSEIIEGISAMNSLNYGGTNSFVGLGFGLRTLSPKWREFWGLDADSKVPSDFNSPNRRKIIVIFTDGVNEWGDRSYRNQRVRSEAEFQTILTPDKYAEIRNDFRRGRIIGVRPGAPGSPVRSHYPGSDVTSYGRITEERLGTSDFSEATNIINTKMADLCNKVKTENGVTVYTIIYGNRFDPSDPGDENANLFKSCASSPQNFFFAPDTEAIQGAFESIANQINILRLSE